MRVLDKLKWHENGDSGAGLFIEWAAKRDLLGDEIAPDHARDVKRGALSGTRLLEIHDGTFTSDMVLPEARDFAALCFGAACSPPTTLRGLDAAYAKFRAATPMRAKPTKTSSALQGRLTRLRALAKKPHAVEVEHLTPFVQLADPAAAAPLRELAEQHAWRRTGRGFVLLGLWVDAIALVLEKGPSVLAARVIAKKIDAGIAIGTLEELHTTASALALLELTAWAEKRKQRGLLGEGLDALGSVLEHEGVRLTAPQAKVARELAHRLLGRKPTPLEQVRCFNVLESVGDAKSLEIITSLPPLRNEWRNCEKPVVRVLEKRLQ